MTAVARCLDGDKLGRSTHVISYVKFSFNLAARSALPCLFFMYTSRRPTFRGMSRTLPGRNEAIARELLGLVQG